MFKEIYEEIEQLRYDDHRLYHQSRINQTLHLISACMFLCTYVLIWFRPADAAILGWVGGMVVRQTGHYVFEPTGFDQVNNLTNARKEEIKVGFNVYRKTAFLLAWISVPLALYFSPTAFGMLPADDSFQAFWDRVGMVWLALGLGGFFLRVAYLLAFRSVRTGVAWFAKIITDPFHNVHGYWRSPLYLLRGQLIEPMERVDRYV